MSKRKSETQERLEADRRVDLKRTWEEEEDKELDPKFVNESKARKEN